MSVATTKEQGSIVKNKFKSINLKNNYKLLEYAMKGVPPQLFYDFASVITMPDKNLADMLHISTRTVSNYVAKKKSLAAVQGEHLLKLIALYEKGEEIFGSVDEFNYWLKKPFWDATAKPIDWLITPGGTDMLMEELTKLAYGDAI